MKLLWIAEEKESLEPLQSFWDRYELDIILYNNARKAIDNLDEIDPHIVVFNGLDFPRHWKVAVRMIRDNKDYRKALFILLKGENFTAEDAMKASWLGVNGLLNLNDIAKGDSSGLEELILRYMPLARKRIDPAYKGELVFLSPGENRLCSGEIIFLEPDNAHFQPRDTQVIRNCSVGDIIKNASVKIHGSIETMDFKILSNNGSLQLRKETLSCQTPSNALLYHNI